MAGLFGSKQSADTIEYLIKRWPPAAVLIQTALHQALQGDVDRAGRVLRCGQERREESPACGAELGRKLARLFPTIAPSDGSLGDLR